VAQLLHAAGFPIAAQNIAIYSTVPVGSGLSSSAAIEVSSALALLAGRKIPGRELARLCQRAEIEFVGMPCGIMDQYVSIFGEKDKAIRIDCRAITHESIELPPDVAIIAVNSMVKHELGSTAYRERVRECEEAVAIIRKKYPDKESLRDVSSAELETVRPEMPDVLYRRARHVVTEDERVEAFSSACVAGDVNSMGALFVASHRSLQHDYEVSRTGFPGGFCDRNGRCVWRAYDRRRVRRLYGQPGGTCSSGTV
jgi:galactokinase